MKITQVTAFSLCLVLVSSYLLPRTRPPVQKNRRQIKFPPEFQADGHKIQPNLRIPNEKFCQSKRRGSNRESMILPWWTVYCERLLETEEKLIRQNKILKPVYRRVLNMVQEYKKKKDLRRALSEILK